MNETWKEEAYSLWQQEKSWTEITTAIRATYFKELTETQVREKVRWYIRNLPEYKKDRVEYVDKKPTPTQEDVNAYWEALKATNASISKLDTKQTSATIRIKDNKPIGIAFWGDWHTGARGVDYEQLEHDKEVIIHTDGLYYIGMGDYKDNANAYIHADSTFESIAVPEMQDLIVLDIVGQTADKGLAYCRGCHDDWDHKLSDRDFVQEIAAKSDAVNLWHGGKLHIMLGDNEYKIVARHKYKNESGLNTTNVQRNMANDYGAFDIFAVAHKHFSDLQQIRRMGMEMTYVRSGGYKRYDEYGQKLAGYEGELNVPVMILFPDKHKVLPFRNLDDGAQILTMLRGL